MSNKLGKIFQISLFGESHGEIIGVTISNIAPGIKIDLETIKEDLSLRRPQLSSESGRIEADNFKIISGYFNGYTTGAPLTIIIENKDIKSSDYDNISQTFRPSHADYPAYIHSLGYNDYRGGGVFSGRLSAPLVIAGSIATQVLKTKGIVIESHINEVGNIIDDRFNEEIIIDQIKKIRENKLNVINKDIEETILNTLSEVSAKNDSIGAVMESVVYNLEAGIGEPPFMRLDSILSAYLMNIPSIKGVSFGSGFKYKDYLGSEVLDEYYFSENKVKTYQNYSGGIIGGLSNGQPIIINTVVKPPASISQKMRTIKKSDFSNYEFEISGRHDSAIFTRISVILNSLIALALVDLLSIRYGYTYFRGED